MAFKLGKLWANRGMPLYMEDLFDEWETGPEGQLNAMAFWMKPYM